MMWIFWEQKTEKSFSIGSFFSLFLNICILVPKTVSFQIPCGSNVNTTRWRCRAGGWLAASPQERPGESTLTCRRVQTRFLLHKEQTKPAEQQPSAAVTLADDEQSLTSWKKPGRAAEMLTVRENESPLLKKLSAAAVGLWLINTAAMLLSAPVFHVSLRQEKSSDWWGRSSLLGLMGAIGNFPKKLEWAEHQWTLKSFRILLASFFTHLQSKHQQLLCEPLICKKSFFYTELLLLQWQDPEFKKLFKKKNVKLLHLCG